MYQSTSVAAAWDCLRRGDVNGASAASRASSSGTSATGRVTDVAASRRRRCSASQCRRRRAKTQSSHTRRDRPRPEYFAGVPDPIFWKVMEYWRLGDWRRPYQSPLPFHDGPPRYRGPGGTLFRGD